MRERRFRIDLGWVLFREKIDAGLRPQDQRPTLIGTGVQRYLHLRSDLRRREEIECGSRGIGQDERSIEAKRVDLATGRRVDIDGASRIVEYNLVLTRLK